MDGINATRSALRALASAFALLLLAAVPALAADPAPYGRHDAGGFRNVLPTGEAGTDNAAQLAQFELDPNALPPHWNDQSKLYEGLVYASAKPGFGMSGVDRFFKDATFGVKPGHVESTTTPEPGVRIVRDDQYGIPHIYGDTRAETMFGAGYANAQDRLFLMDILRHTGKAQLSSFIGGSPSNRAMDHAQWAAAPYTDADLQKQFDNAPKYYGHQGVLLQHDVTAYVAGINAYIDDTVTNPTLLPAEYAALGKTPQQWSVTDVIAEASLIGGIFGRGGGAELRSAELEQAFVKRFGKRAGKRAWSDFREHNDPEAPTTVLGKRFPYETTSPFAKRGLAMPDPGSVKAAPVAPKISAAAASTSTLASPYDFSGLGAALRNALRSPGHASNWELINASNSKTGHPIGVLGPQVGYYQPQILMEEDLHGPGIDARGATFPGVGLYILLGHGRDYAWSATTATSDNVDTFAEVLCKDAFHYRYKGKCLPMRPLVRNNAWTPNGVDMTPPGSETLTAYLTVHGIVFARGKVHGKKVAFVSSRSTYGHEADSALFFRDLNDPKFMKGGVSSFRKAAKFMNFAFNWSYIDSKHTAYQLTGWYPQRASGTSPDFPILGTGNYDWKGFDPKTREASWLGDAHLPHVVDQPYMVSWNNKQAPGWSAADDQYGFGPIYRQQMIAGRIRHDLRGGRKMTLPQLVQAMEEPATQDIRGVKLLPILLHAIGNPHDSKLKAAIAELRAWRKAGSHRRDLNKDGADEMTPAITLMDAWYPRLLAAEFKPALGKKLFKQTRGMIGFGAPGGHAPGSYPSFSDGWYGYVSKDLRDVYGAHPRAPYSRGYCGRGSKGKCRAALRKSLLAATKVTPQQEYGFGDCASDPNPACWDEDRATHTSGISTPELIYQNRPTFQQAVSVTHSVK
jgi:acyl-homoserine lactone acylase PvdQ